MALPRPPFPTRRNRRSNVGWIALTAVAIASVLAAAPAQAERLDQKLDRLLGQRPLAKARVGILVVRASDGTPVYSRGAERPLIPASNQKILTAVAALDQFGPAHRFATKVWASSPLDEQDAVDHLVIEGGGDPAMNSEDWWRLAADLRNEGLRSVRGGLHVDDSAFERAGWHPAWGRVSARAYHAPVGALTANYGSYFVAITPDPKIGQPAHVELDPPVPYLEVLNRTRTGARSAKRQLSVDRAFAETESGLRNETVKVDGVTPVRGGTDRFPRSVLDPGLYAGSVLRLQLEANGISVAGGVRRSAAGAEKGVLLLERPGRTLAEIVGLCLKYSNNSIAETLVKHLGAHATGARAEAIQQGNWEGGARALRARLSRLGIELGEGRVVDGSGLATQNRVAPRAFVDALRIGRLQFSWGPEFMAAMPIAELDGTLEKRLRGGRGRIRAKTGLLSDASVATLSGYAERADGETLIFSILVNGHSGGSGAAMRAVDALALSLLEADLPPGLPDVSLSLH